MVGAAPIEFFFDFSSPYSYFASLEIDDMAAEFGREVAWKPILLGPAFKAAGNLPLIRQPLKGPYAQADWERIARMTGAAYRLPVPFPVATLAAARAFWWLSATDPTRSKPFARAIFAAYFAEGRDISQVAAAAEAALVAGVEPERLLAAIEDPEWKQKARDETDSAVARGVFGGPFVIVDGEPFWGWDRLWMVSAWLERGGW